MARAKKFSGKEIVAAIQHEQNADLHALELCYTLKEDRIKQLQRMRSSALDMLILVQRLGLDDKDIEVVAEYSAKVVGMLSKEAGVLA